MRLVDPVFSRSAWLVSDGNGDQEDPPLIEKYHEPRVVSVAVMAKPLIELVSASVMLLEVASDETRKPTAPEAAAASSATEDAVSAVSDNTGASFWPVRLITCATVTDLGSPWPWAPPLFRSFSTQSRVTLAVAALPRNWPVNW